MMQWETVIGLEVHVQLATQSKIFSGASTAFGAEPNSQACAVDLGLPGVLPVLNESAVAMAVQFGLGIDAEIPEVSIFDRKNYFYPDLPKGYQTSQMYHPIVGPGEVEITLEDGETKRIRVHHAHLEEDTASHSTNFSTACHGMTGVDLNRAGTPLLEIVSEPDMRSAKEAAAYLKAIHSIVTYLGISDGNMAEGSMRCDVNVSVRPKGQEAFGTRAEIKNVNSFRFVERAIAFEVERQIELLEDGGKVVQETRLYDPEPTRPAACAPRRRPTTTVTSPAPTCCRWCSTMPTWITCAARCRNCRPRSARASRASWACPPTTPAYFRRPAPWPTSSRA